jgi:hypothetical protein
MVTRPISFRPSMEPAVDVCNTGLTSKDLKHAQKTLDPEVDLAVYPHLCYAHTSQTREGRNELD